MIDIIYLLLEICENILLMYLKHKIFVKNILK